MSERGVNETIAQIGVCLRQIELNLGTIRTSTETIEKAHDEIKELYYALLLKEAKREEETKKQGLMGNIVVDMLEKAEDAKEDCPYCGKRLSAEKIRELDKHGRWYCNNCKSFFYMSMASLCPYCDSKDIRLAIRR